jgi:hypothetical protein
MHGYQNLNPSQLGKGTSDGDSRAEHAGFGFEFSWRVVEVDCDLHWPFGHTPKSKLRYAE